METIKYNMDEYISFQESLREISSKEEFGKFLSQTYYRFLNEFRDMSISYIKEMLTNSTTNILDESEKANKKILAKITSLFKSIYDNEDTREMYFGCLETNITNVSISALIEDIKKSTFEKTYLSLFFIAENIREPVLIIQTAIDFLYLYYTNKKIELTEDIETLFYAPQTNYLN